MRQRGRATTICGEGEDEAAKKTEALFSFKFIYKMCTIIFLFVFDKYYLIIN